MEKKVLFFICVLIINSLSIFAGNRETIYEAYIHNRMSEWKILTDQMNSLTVKSDELLLELVNFQYGYIGWCMESNRKEEAQSYLKLAENILKTLENDKYHPSLVLAYKSAFYGFRIGLNKFSAPFNGPKSTACANQAVQLDQENSLAYIQLGNGKLHAPALMGGSKTEAIVYFLKAKTLMEKNKDQLHGDWNYINLLVTLATAYQLNDDDTNSKKIYEEILKFEPEFLLVKDKLYPELLKKMK